MANDITEAVDNVDRLTKYKRFITKIFIYRCLKMTSTLNLLEEEDEKNVDSNLKICSQVEN